MSTYVYIDMHELGASDVSHGLPPSTHDPRRLAPWRLARR
jgi:hypothetical protein